MSTETVPRATLKMIEGKRGARVFAFPTCALAPVLQSGRKGPHPKGIVTLWRERSKRSVKLRVLELMSARVSALHARDKTITRIIEVQAALEEAKKADAQAHCEWRAIDNLVKDIELQLATLVRVESAA